MDVESTTVADAPQDTAPSSDAPLSLREGDEAIAALLGDSDVAPIPAEGQEGNDAGDAPVEDDDDLTVDPDAPPEDPETPEAHDDPDTAKGGQFVPDSGKVQYQGRTLTVAELKEFVETRAKEQQGGYSKLVQEHSDNVKAFETRNSELSQRAEKLEKQADFIASFAEAYVPRPPVKPEQPATVDPVAWSAYAEAKENYDELMNWWQQAKATKQEADAQKQSETQAQVQARVTEEKGKLLEALPGLKDPAKAETFWKRTVAQGAEFYGFTKDEVLGLQDSRMVRALNDALTFRARQAKTPQAQKAIEAKPALVTGSGKRQNPGAEGKRSFQKGIDRLRQTGSARDADAILQAFVD